VVVKKELQLPIAISKFFNPVELSNDQFRVFYNDYSLANDKFYKLDAFLKVPEGVKPGDFLKKLGAFFSAICHFKCTANPSMDDIQQIYAAAKLQIKEEDKLLNIPILIESEACHCE
jgi:hypothetical protein